MVAGLYQRCAHEDEDLDVHEISQDSTKVLRTWSVMSHSSSCETGVINKQALDYLQFSATGSQSY